MRTTESPQMGLTSLQTDPLYCQEDHYWDAEDNVDIVQPPELRLLAPPAPEEEWVELLSTLAAKERATHLDIPDGYPGAGGAALYLRSARRGAVQWVARACAVHGFSAMTALLAVSYLDRCFLGGSAAGVGLRLQAELPWMERLSAVACLSLAAKVEETQVPLLLDLQAAAAEGGGSAAGEYIFEAKTVRRMELLILSTLGWRMISVTPLSFIEHLLPKVAAAAACGGGALMGVLKSSNAILLSVVADWRWVMYPASVWAASVLLYVLEEKLEPVNVLALLGLTKETVEGCYYVILETQDMNTSGNKRKQFSSHDHHSSPPSPNGVLNSCFSYDSSCDSWAATWSSSVSSSPEPRPFKRLYCGNEE